MPEILQVVLIIDSNQMAVKGVAGDSVSAQFEFVTNVSVVRKQLGRLIRRLLLALNLPNSKRIVSLLVFSGSFGLIFLLYWRAGFAMSEQSSDEFLYWQLVLVVVLLSAPLTWVMNTVWLVTLLPFAVNGLSMSEPSYRRAALIMILLGLFAAALPITGRFTFCSPLEL